MKKGNLIYYCLLGIVLLVLLLDVLSTKQVSWTKTFSRFDKNPYGAYALGQLVGDIFPDQQVEQSNLTYFEIMKEAGVPNSLMSISEDFRPDAQSQDSLLAHVGRGGSALISAHRIPGTLSDTLGVVLARQKYEFDDVTDRQDSSLFEQGGEHYRYSKKELIWFVEEYPAASKVITTNDAGKPTTISFGFGKGTFVINTTPIIFTNHFLLYGDNHKAVSAILSTLPPEGLHWTEYYQVGKIDSSSPFRVVLEYPPLRYALYATLLLIILYMVFEAKRKQRVIPQIKAPVNQTVQFIQTVGNLYLNTGNHRASALNQLNYFKEYLALKMNIHVGDAPDTVATIAARSGKEESLVNRLMEQAMFIEKAPAISEQTLVEFNKDLYQFYNK
ncbi:MAG: hypothetical protein RIG77_01200 [Cyclobacteriaceae bacterium]